MIRPRLAAPDRCPFCNFVGSVKPEQSIKGDDAVWAWCCHHCGARWPIPDDGLPERRSATGDRRKQSRQERRAKDVDTGDS